ncbi:chorismate dehydratase [Nitratiruptor sp. YY08-26]|nr:MqnA/MqnD/SBP family protein [Nitratiruptor sp. YY08-13]BCD62967.1 chorismate dehydratase [Nitratiruptor sp. YY08-13]BCD66902.1 chorismate dehydratase [Nitratiruptor sp. YY08-26]
MDFANFIKKFQYNYAMIIGKIDYINLLPFYVFLKKELKHSADKAALTYYKGVPSHINRLFIKGRVEAAMISSIVSKKYACTDFGIVAHKRVKSVIVCPGENKEDEESNTSNVLAKVLGIKGEVIIGDKALLKTDGCIDLAQKWYERYRLPFVFARFCYKKNPKAYKALAKKFLHSHTKIPHYILSRYTKRSGLSHKEIKNYLQLIDYKIGRKEKQSLKKFFQLQR